MPQHPSVTLYEKFSEGGWVTLSVTGVVIVSCFLIHRHYEKTRSALRRLEDILPRMPEKASAKIPEKSFRLPAALLMVNGYNGFGIHSFLAIHRFFPGHFKNFVFLSVGAVDSSRFKGAEELQKLKESVSADLEKYVKLANGMSLYAESHMLLETDVVEGLETLCHREGAHWPKKSYFMGQLVFEADNFWNRFLHNQTSFTLQRRLIFRGYEVVVLPIRVRLQQTRLPG